MNSKYYKLHSDREARLEANVEVEGSKRNKLWLRSRGHGLSVEELTLANIATLKYRYLYLPSAAASPANG